MTNAEQTTGGEDTRRILEVAREVLGDLDVDAVLSRVVRAARELSGARYAALGVLDADRKRLERFITDGIEDEVAEAIGPRPTGRGVLGELIRDARPLRLADVGAHPRSYGFPAGHPPMKTFLGVPIVIDGEPYGNLYLTDKHVGEFTAQDEATVQLLAGFAALAIDHARRYSGLAASHGELQRTVDALDATMQIAAAVGGETDLDTVLELVAKRGRALVSARTLVIEHLRDGEMVVAVGAGEMPPELIGKAVDVRDSVASAALRTRRTLRLEEEPNRARFERHGLGRLGLRATAGLIVPLLFRGHGHGVLLAIDRLDDGPGFTAEDQRLLEAFAASAATAIATAATVESDRRRNRLAAAEQERARWARELHDETLQSLAAIKLGLTSGLRCKDPEIGATRIAEAASQLEQEIANLRALITDLRPAALDEVGLGAAIRDLATRARRAGLEVGVAIDLASETGRAEGRLAADLETAIYRIVQEAITNARKHGHAAAVSVQISEDETTVRAVIRDDGRGFDPDADTDGFGLLGMRERTELMRGALEVRTAPGEGTVVTATLPAVRAGRERSGPRPTGAQRHELPRSGAARTA